MVNSSLCARVSPGESTSHMMQSDVTSMAVVTGEEAAVAPVLETAAAQAQSVPTIGPLGVPWLRHDNFMTVKKVCSGEGIMHTKKTSVLRIVQELKKGRTHIEQELAYLEAQLLHVSDFLGGSVNKLELHSTDDDRPTLAAVGEDELHGVRVGKGKTTVVANDSTNPLNPVMTLVEEDLASDAPCTTVGLWRYVSFLSLFKTVTLEDMQEALLLEEPTSVATIEARDSDQDTYLSGLSDGVHALPTLDETPQKQSERVATAQTNELLRMRLLAAMLPEVSKGIKAKESDVDAALALEKEDVEMTIVPETWISNSWNCSRTLERLGDIGLIDTASTNGTVRSVLHPQDDEVSNEIRVLQTELTRQVRRNNDFKRMLRRSLERLKPWLTHDEEIQQLENKFLKMWRRKKELQRKKKHKDKKMMRKEASYKSLLVPSLPL